MPAPAPAGTIRRADQDPDYTHFGVVRGQIGPWEDGQRVDPAPGYFEWWYFEVHLPDRTGLVVCILSKPLDQSQGELEPVVSVKIKLPNESIARGGESTFAKSQYSAQTTSCNVKLGPNTCVDLGNGRYRIEFDRGDIKGAIDLEALVPPIRIGTGHLLFEHGKNDQYLVDRSIK